MQILSPLEKGLQAAAQEVIVGVGHLSVDVDLQNPDLVSGALGAAQAPFVSSGSPVSPVGQLEATAVMSHARSDVLTLGRCFQLASLLCPSKFEPLSTGGLDMPNHCRSVGARWHANAHAPMASCQAGASTCSCPMLAKL